MRIRLLAIGKPRSDFKGFIDDFQKRISKYVNFEYRVMKSSRIEGQKGLDEEADNILKTVDDKEMLIILTRATKQFSSMDLANLINNNLQLSRDITFVIGSADGTATKLKRRANGILSMSKMTLQHDIALILILEQIYRAFTIINKHPYHRRSS